jgi:hypothetical protein
MSLAAPGVVLACSRFVLRGPSPVRLHCGGEGREETFPADYVGQAEGPQPGQQLLFDAGQGEDRPRRVTFPPDGVQRFHRREVNLDVGLASSGRGACGQRDKTSTAAATAAVADRTPMPRANEPSCAKNA